MKDFTENVITKTNTDIKNQHINLNNGDHWKTIHTAMHTGYYHYTNLIHGSQHPLQNESFLMMVTIVEIHILILDVCLMQQDTIEVFKIDWNNNGACSRITVIL